MSRDEPGAGWRVGRTSQHHGVIQSGRLPTPSRPAGCELNLSRQSQPVA
jgi:hypothetical protein